jgi:transposase
LRPRYHVHFTPTSSSWLNQIERWFVEITRKRIRRGTFRSVRDLIKAIEDYIPRYNQNPQPFEWVASASKIIQKAFRRLPHPEFATTHRSGGG